MIKIELTKEKCQFCQELFKEKQLIMSFKTAYVDGTDELYHVHTECVEQAMAGYRQKQAKEWADKHHGYPPGLHASEPDIQLFKDSEFALNAAQAEIRAMYKREGYKGSNVLNTVDHALDELQERLRVIGPGSNNLEIKIIPSDPDEDDGRFCWEIFNGSECVGESRTDYSSKEEAKDAAEKEKQIICQTLLK